eukprot:scaffold191_cov273-Chaetoceros_neogracile.AAC.24
MSVNAASPLAQEIGGQGTQVSDSASALTVKGSGGIGSASDNISISIMISTFDNQRNVTVVWYGVVWYGMAMQYTFLMLKR